MSVEVAVHDINLDREEMTRHTLSFSTNINVADGHGVMYIGLGDEEI